MNLLRLDNTTVFSLTKSEISYKTSDLYGETNLFFPITKIASTQCGFLKPIQYLFIALALFIVDLYLHFSIRGGIGLIFWVFVVIALCFIIAYFLEKTITIGVESSGGQKAEIVFKRSVIEGVSIDINKAREALKLINNTIIDVSHINKSDTKKYAPQEKAFKVFCPNCKNEYNLTKEYLGQQATCAKCRVEFTIPRIEDINS